MRRFIVYLISGCDFFLNASFISETADVSLSAPYWQQSSSPLRWLSACSSITAATHHTETPTWSRGVWPRDPALWRLNVDLRPRMPHTSHDGNKSEINTSEVTAQNVLTNARACLFTHI